MDHMKVNDSAALACQGISKSFGSHRVLKSIDVQFPLGGKFTGLLGANGAGKSTLMKILCGQQTQFEGSLSFEGKPFSPKTTRDAFDRGIYIIPQELGLLKHLSVVENILLAKEPKKGALLDQEKGREIVDAALKRIGLEIDPLLPVEELTSAQQQLVAIARALTFDTRLLILDEPTSMLTDHEAKRLRKVLLELKSEGVSGVYITHRLSELFGLVDQVIALKDGSVAGISEVNPDSDPKELSKRWVNWMAEDRAIQRQSSSTTKELGDVVLRVKNLVTKAHPVTENSGLSFDLRKGEVLGIVGLVGSGRTEILRVLSGADEPLSGSVWMDEREIPSADVKAAIKRGILWSPENRRHEGLHLDQSVEFNAFLFNSDTYSRRGWISHNAEKKCLDDCLDKVSVDFASADQTAGTLSGGNQQRLILGKILNLGGQVILLDEVTSGVDVMTKGDILNSIRELSNEGNAIIFVSSEWEEVFEVSDRVLVLSEGRLVRELYPTKDLISPAQVLGLVQDASSNGDHFSKPATEQPHLGVNA